MALKKQKTLPNGVSGEYWRITRISVDKDQNKVTYELSLYLDKARRDAGTRPLDFKKLFVFEVTREELSEDLSELGYSKIKEKANSQIPDPFSKAQIKPTLPGDLDLNQAEDI